MFVINYFCCLFCCFCFILFYFFIFLFFIIFTFLYINQEKGKILLNEDSYQRTYFVSN